MKPASGTEISKKEKKMITIVSSEVAKEGYEFVFLGPENECKNCRLKNVCVGLRVGGRYRIVGVRDKEHDCKLVNGPGRVVDVEEMPFYVAVEKKKAIEDAIVSPEITDCSHVGCENYPVCHPLALDRDEKLKIVGLSGKMECRAGLDLVKARVVFPD